MAVEDLAGIGKAMKGAAELSNSQLVNKFYDDGLSGPIKEVSGLITDATKIARSYLQNYARHLESSRERVERHIAEACSQIPPERIAEPKPHVVAPIFQELALRDEEDILTKCFQELLKRAFDKERQHQLHPSFAKTLSELVPDEATVIALLYQYGWRALPVPREHIIYYYDFPIAKLTSPESFPLYVTHLVSLGIVERERERASGHAINIPYAGPRDGFPRSDAQDVVFLSPMGFAIAKICVPPGFQPSLGEESETHEYFRHRNIAPYLPLFDSGDWPLVHTFIQPVGEWKRHRSMRR